MTEKMRFSRCLCSIFGVVTDVTGTRGVCSYSCHILFVSLLISFYRNLEESVVTVVTVGKSGSISVTSDVTGGHFMPVTSVTA